MAAKPLVNIDIISDVMCPWCWVGKRKLESSMKALEDKIQFRVRWHPYLLRPAAPPEGIPIPSAFRSGPRVTQLQQAGAAVGINFTFKNTSFPSTIRSHALLELAAAKDDGVKQNDVAELLFKAYFVDGKMLTDDDVVDVGKQAGFEANEIRAYISKQENLDHVVRTAKSWADKGVEAHVFWCSG
ncbi:uncharacterized protein LOC112555853 isoform X2 [Pomacea canaliculata]|uniref:uncharacterized protein LOC112555853 isoform X2 n=1 Tax=Pomacea canaliculata TaxID=400727 RepID=UPI000D72F387|nr:uncharacterized protein LOC112555853 isoform X2 [Pomacea canaliculata]